MIVSATLAPADEHERWVAEYDLLSGTQEGSIVVGHTNYWSLILKEGLAGYGVALIAPKARASSLSYVAYGHKA